MALAADYVFNQAVIAANGVRQASIASAYATFVAAGFTPAAYATYNSAVAAADVAYFTAVNTARNTQGNTIQQAGNTGPVGGNIANLLWQGN
jgi:hypothetical protein